MFSPMFSPRCSFISKKVLPNAEFQPNILKIMAAIDSDMKFEDHNCAPSSIANSAYIAFFFIIFFYFISLL